MTINLLPDDLKTGKGVASTIRRLKKLVFMWTFFLILGGAMGVSLLVFYTGQADSLAKDNEELKSSISNLESSEQKLVLLKDRLLKLKDILAKRDNYDKLKKVDDIVSAVPPDTSFVASHLDNEKTDLTLLAKSSASLSQIFGSFDAKIFKQVVVKNLTFNPFSGFELSLSIFN